MTTRTTEEIQASPLWNPDLAPTTPARRTWTAYDMAALWISMSVVITTSPTWMDSIYSYAWFVTFAIGFVLYLLLMIRTSAQSSRSWRR